MTDALFKHAVREWWHLLHDDDVAEIQVVDNGTAFLKHVDGTTRNTSKKIDSDMTMAFARLCASRASQSLIQRETIDCSITVDGRQYRVALYMPPATSTPQFIVRRYVAGGITLDRMRQQDVITSDDALRVIKAHAEGKILISGAPGCGKTTLLNAILLHVSQHDPKRCVVIEEDSREIDAVTENATYFTNTSKTDVDELVKKTLRANPERWIVGEIRSGTLAKGYYDAVTTGSRAALATIHGDSAQGAFDRFAAFLAGYGIQLNDAKMNAGIIIHCAFSVETGQRIIPEIFSPADGKYLVGSSSLPKGTANE